jgi:hypothetical protein
VGGKVRLGIACQADGEPCRADVAGRLDQTLAAHRMGAAPGRLDAAETRGLLGGTPAPARATCRQGFAYVLAASIDVRYAGAEDGAHFAFARGSLRLYDLTTGRAVASHATGDLKGGAVARAAALDKALAGALDALTGELAAQLAARP